MRTLRPPAEPVGWPDDAGRDRLIGDWHIFQRSGGHRTSTDDLITACLERFAPPLRDKQIAVEFDAHAPQTVWVDVDVLEQILVNLFSNVEKYAAAGKLLKIVSSQVGDRTTIVVEDRGPGIPAGQRERIFEPFHRVSHALEDSPGTGIGLSIARDLARNHGGDVVWEAAEQGARFRVTLHTPHSES